MNARSDYDIDGHTCIMGVYIHMDVLTIVTNTMICEESFGYEKINGI